MSRSFGRHMYFGGLFNMDQLDTEADYAVFDDIQGGFEYWPAYKSWLGGQENLPPRTNTDTSRSSGSASPASTVAMTSQEWDAALILAGFKGTA